MHWSYIFLALTKYCCSLWFTGHLPHTTKCWFWFKVERSSEVENLNLFGGIFKIHALHMIGSICFRCENKMTNGVKQSHFNHYDIISDVTAQLWILSSIFMFLSVALGPSSKAHIFGVNVDIAIIFLSYIWLKKIAGQRSWSFQVTMRLKWL